MLTKAKPRGVGGVPVGGTFLYADHLHMRVDDDLGLLADHERDTVFAVDLETGMLDSFLPGVEVLEVK